MKARKPFRKMPDKLWCVDAVGYRFLGMKALANRVMAIAVLAEPGNRWAVFVDAVPNKARTLTHIRRVIKAGHKQNRDMGRALFPALAAHPGLRYRK